ncbi:MAG: 3-oxoacyl-ACP synthase, partial [Muribaculaceae bacterium]|nr:3-oxoacyl-ACP synthase [Muribaculaceae bacterium]
LEHLVYKAGGSALPTSHETLDADFHYVYQEGRAVYRHDVIEMLTSSQYVMKCINLSNHNIQLFLPHQANLRIIEAVGARLSIDESKVLVNIQHRGNTSAASIPLCLDENKHRLHKGDKMVLTAFGAGFTWGAIYLVWSL